MINEKKKKTYTVDINHGEFTLCRVSEDCRIGVISSIDSNENYVIVKSEGGNTLMMSTSSIETILFLSEEKIEVPVMEAA